MKRNFVKFCRNFVLPKPCFVFIGEISSKNSAKRNETKFLLHISINTYMHICPCMCEKTCKCTYMFIPHVHTSCLSLMSLLHVHSTFPCCMSMPHVHGSCPYRISMLHLHTACPYCTPMLQVISVCTCCMSKKHVNTAFVSGEPYY
jgi:hypothetical protein